MLYATIVTHDGRVTVLAFFSWLSSLKTLNLLHSIPKKYQVQGTIHKVVLVKKGKQKNIT